MNRDISDVLKDWEFDPENSVRIIAGEDGREIMQVRLPLGLEQYELDGRPDGTRPFGRDTVLEEIKRRVSEFNAEHGEDEGFSIDHDDFLMLQNEGIIFYYRYLLLFHLQDYRRTARDTAHNLELCSIVERYCTNQEDRASLLQYKPYILRVNALSRAMVQLEKNRKDQAVQIMETAISMIECLDPVATEEFKVERKRALTHLQEMKTQVQNQNMTEKETLESELEEAVQDEDYERAAELRDRISELEDVDGP